MHREQRTVAHRCDAVDIIGGGRGIREGSMRMRLLVTRRKCGKRSYGIRIWWHHAFVYDYYGCTLRHTMSVTLRASVL